MIIRNEGEKIPPCPIPHPNPRPTFARRGAEVSPVVVGADELRIRFHLCRLGVVL